MLIKSGALIGSAKPEVVLTPGMLDQAFDVNMKCGRRRSPGRISGMRRIFGTEFADDL